MSAAPSFKSQYWGTFVRPLSTFKSVCCSPELLRTGVLAVSIPAIAYTFVYVFLIFGGGQPFKPWLDIPLDLYYRYNVFFCAPSMFLGWILGAGVMHLLARSAASNGTYDQTLAVLGLAIGVASWSTGIHDLLTSFLGATSQTTSTHLTLQPSGEPCCVDSDVHLPCLVPGPVYDSRAYRLWPICRSVGFTGLRGIRCVPGFLPDL